MSLFWDTSAKPDTHPGTSLSCLERLQGYCSQHLSRLSSSRQQYRRTSAELKKHRSAVWQRTEESWLELALFQHIYVV